MRALGAVCMKKVRRLVPQLRIYVNYRLVVCGGACVVVSAKGHHIPLPPGILACSGPWPLRVHDALHCTRLPPQF